MSSYKLTPDDSRVQHKYANLNGQQYHYLLAEPTNSARATLFLIHGWPDMSFGYRYQVPFLVDQGYRVIVPDMMGYGHTAAPTELAFYTMKRASDDMVALAKLLEVTDIHLIGHDWGGAVVWRTALWYPELVKSVVVVCTPFSPPSKTFVPLEQMVQSGRVPNFAYQLQLASGEVEKHIEGKAEIRKFVNAMYGGQGPSGEVGFRVEQGIIFENLDRLAPTRLVESGELDHYAECYARNGMRGPLNWYRTRELNFKEEGPLVESMGEQVKLKMPCLFIKASKDEALPTWMSENMGQYFAHLTVKDVEAHHWALWEKPQECNTAMKEFLNEVFSSTKKSNL